MNYLDLQPQFKRYALYERGMKPLTYKSILTSLKMCAECSQTEDTTEWTTEVIREFLIHGREARGWSARTFRNHRQYLMSFFNWAVRTKMCNENPVTDIEKPKLPKKLPRFLTKEQILTITSHIRWYEWRYKFEAVRNETIILMLVMTGLRLAELLNLEFMDVNIPSSEIFVRQGKGEKDRMVPIHPKLLPVLRVYLEAIKKRRKPSQWFFTGVQSAKQLSGKNVRTICKKISLDTGIKFTPHMLRHTFGRLAVEGGFDLYKIKEVMGHSDITTTQIYLSVSTESVKKSFGQVALL